MFAACYVYSKKKQRVSWSTQYTDAAAECWKQNGCLYSIIPSAILVFKIRHNGCIMEYCEKKNTFQWGWHLKPPRKPLSTLAIAQTIRIDPPYITSLKKRRNVADWERGIHGSTSKCVGTSACETGKAVLSSWPVALLSRPTDEGPAGWEPGPAGTAPGRGCSAGGQSGNPGGGESGRGEGWCVSMTIKNG